MWTQEKPPCGRDRQDSPDFLRTLRIQTSGNCHCARTCSRLSHGWAPASSDGSVEPSNNAASLLSWNLTKPWASEEEKKEVNQEQTCCHTGSGEARSLQAEHSSKGFGAHREGAKGTTCLYHRIVFLSFTHPSVIPKRADKATV